MEEEELLINGALLAEEEKMPKKVWFLIVGTFISTVGGSFLWPLNSIYIHDHLGKSMSLAGLILALNSLAAIFGNLLGGSLFDKLGGYKAILIGALLNLLSVACLTMWHDWPQYVIFLIATGFSGGIVYPAMYALVGQAWPAGGRRAFNAIFLANNIGVAIGPAIAGIVADINFEYVFIANFVTYIIFFIVVITTYKRFDERVEKSKETVVETASTSKAPFIAILIVSNALVLCWLAYSQWVATISSHTQSIGMSLSEYSLLWTINGLLIVLFQPLIRPLIRRWEQKVKHQLVLGLLLMAGSFGIVSIAGDFKMFAAAMVLLTLGEVFFSPVIPLIANQLAPEGKQGLYQGVVNSASTIGRMLGPLVGGVMVDVYGMQALMILLIGLLVIAILPCVVYDWHLKREKV